jgi:hypothetical protein
MADARVTGKLGTPVALVANTVRGDLSTSGARDGDASLRFDLRGPMGRAQISVDAARDGGPWALSRLDVGPVQK